MLSTDVRIDEHYHQVDGQEGEGCGNNYHVRHVKGATTSPFLKKSRQKN